MPADVAVAPAFAEHAEPASTVASDRLELTDAAPSAVPIEDIIRVTDTVAVLVTDLAAGDIFPATTVVRRTYAT